MKKNSFLWMSTLLLAIAGLGSCSSDDDWVSYSDGNWLTGHQVTYRSDAYSLGYGLRNEKGDRTLTFKEGETIIFDVTVYNNTDYKLHMADERDILFSAMSVYRSDGEYVKNPWERAFHTFELRWITVEANSRLHWSCPWIYDERFVHDDRYGSSTSYSAKDVYPAMDPLPKGKYYVQIKSSVMYLIADDPTPGAGTRGNDDIELRIPFTVE